MAPTRTSPRLIMLDSTGRRMNLSANCINFSFRRQPPDYFKYAELPKISRNRCVTSPRSGPFDNVEPIIRKSTHRLNGQARDASRGCCAEIPKRHRVTKILDRGNAVLPLVTRGTAQ